MRFSSKTVLCLAFSAVIPASAAHADSAYQPYYAQDSARDSYQFSVAPAAYPAPPQATPEAVTYAQGKDAFYHENNELWAAAGSTFTNYKEAVAPIPDSERGWTPALAFGGSYMSLSKFYAGLDGSFNIGNTHYNGATFDSNTNQYDIPAKSTTSDLFANADVKIGQGLPLSSYFMLMPYADLGFRYWDRNLGQGQEEYYHNFDALGGMMLQIAPAERWMISLSGAGGTTFGSRMTSQVGGSNLNYDLGSAGIEKAEAKLGYDITDRASLFTAFDYDHYHYAASQTIAVNGGTTSEPGSRTSDLGVKVGMAYHFK